MPAFRAGMVLSLHAIPHGGSGTGALDTWYGVRDLASATGR